VALSTVLFLYLGDEDNRIKTEAAEQQEISIERGRKTFLANCLQCHGPAGEGYTAPGEMGTGRIGAALGGINTELNQTGVNADGTPWPGGMDARTTIIHDTIVNGLKNPDGSVRMPAFGAENGGPLNDEQINELILLIQHGDWNETYNQAIEEHGGYPTAGPNAGATQTAEAEGAAPPTEEADSGGGEEGAQEVSVTMHDIFFDPAELSIPADTDVVIKLENQGASVHDFSIDELNIAVTLNPGESGEVTINAPAGTYEYYCSIPGHKAAGMVGTLTVE
jgi:plastocyanin/mono/diheme cytochrome c family protein